LWFPGGSSSGSTKGTVVNVGGTVTGVVGATGAGVIDAFVEFPVCRGAGGEGFGASGGDGVVAGYRGEVGGGEAVVSTGVAVVEVDGLGAGGEGVEFYVEGGGGATGGNIIGEELAIFFGKADVAAISLVFGGVGGVVAGDGNVDVSLRGGVVGDGDGFTEGPGIVVPGGCRWGGAGEVERKDQESGEGEEGEEEKITTIIPN